MLKKIASQVHLKSKNLVVENIIEKMYTELHQRIQNEEDNDRIVLTFLDIQKARPLKKNYKNLRQSTGNIQLTYVSENRLDNDIIPRTIKYYQQIIDIKY